VICVGFPRKLLVRGALTGRFGAAVSASLVLHGLAALALARILPDAGERPRVATLAARLAPPRESAPPGILEDSLEAPRHPAVEKPVKARKPHAQPRPESKAEAEALSALELAEARSRLSSTLFYPPEAVARGLEGEAILLLELGDDGRIVGASLAASSGHRILDEAALAAARRLGSLGPAAAGRTVLFPVRFRLE